MDDPSFQADAVIGAGRGALILALFGAGWLGWGLGEAQAFTKFVGPAFGLIELFLWACSIYVIQKGRMLRKKYPAPPASPRQTISKSFLLVVLTEVLALLLVSLLANRLHRPDLATDWCAMIVGLHFLPLAKIFSSIEHRRRRHPDDPLVRDLLGAVSFEYARDLSLAWNRNPALGRLCLRIVARPKNHALTASVISWLSQSKRLAHSRCEVLRGKRILGGFRFAVLFSPMTSLIPIQRRSSRKPPSSC
jgi:hypothetical protein